LSEEKPPIGGILSEGASRPLLSEKDEKVKEMVMGKIIKKAEEKIMEGGKPRVTEMEVKGCIAESKAEITQQRASSGLKTEQVPLVKKGGNLVISSK